MEGSGEFGRVDESLGVSLRAWSQRVSRRGVISRVGQGLIALIGVRALAPVVLDRRDEAYAEHQQSVWTCDDWITCALCGKPCDCCGGSVSRCPSGTVAAGWWTKCCCRTGKNAKCNTIIYRDCMGSAHCCRLKNCNRTCDWARVYGVGDYACTLMIQGAEC